MVQQERRIFGSLGGRTGEARSSLLGPTERCCRRVVFLLRGVMLRDFLSSASAEISRGGERRNRTQNAHDLNLCERFKSHKSQTQFH